MPTARAAASKAASKPAAAAKPASRAAAKPAAAKASTLASKTAASSRTTKAAPATASRRGKPAPDEDEVDLLAGMSDESPAAGNDDDDASFDLLSDLTEDGGTPWYPWDDDSQPEGIQGTVRYIGSVTREDRFGGGEAPYIEVADKDDPEFIWAVRGYATVLANQLQRHLDNGMAVGDTIAIKYFGEKENRKGDNSYKNFKVVFRAR